MSRISLVAGMVAGAIIVRDATGTPRRAVPPAVHRAGIGRYRRDALRPRLGRLKTTATDDIGARRCARFDALWAGCQTAIGFNSTAGRTNSVWKGVQVQE